MAPDLRQVSAGTRWLLTAEESKSTQVKLAPEGGRNGGAVGSHVVSEAKLMGTAIAEHRRDN